MRKFSWNPSPKHKQRIFSTYSFYFRHLFLQYSSFCSKDGSFIAFLTLLTKRSDLFFKKWKRSFPRFTPLCCKKKEFRKFEFVTKTQFLWNFFRVFEINIKVLELILNSNIIFHFLIVLATEKNVKSILKWCTLSLPLSPYRSNR